MKIAPIEIRNAEFPRTLRGYDPEKVREFLKTVAEQMEELVRENLTLNERIRDLDSKVEDYRRMENIMKEALLTTQRTTEELKKNAQKEAELLISNAKIESEKILENTRKELKKLREEIEFLKSKKEGFLWELKSLLDTQTEWLNAQFRLLEEQKKKI
ncbi:MAG: DivIVA domain-containing protein [Candidatus Hydrothermales bacterium]